MAKSGSLLASDMAPSAAVNVSISTCIRRRSSKAIPLNNVRPLASKY